MSVFTNSKWKYIVTADNTVSYFQMGEEKYAVLAVKGNTLCFDPPLSFARDEITERVSKNDLIWLNIKDDKSFFLLASSVSVHYKGAVVWTCKRQHIRCE